MCDDAPLTPEEFTRVGEALYGPGWKPALARDLGIRDEGQISRMARGLKLIPDGFRADLAEIAKARAAKCAEALDALGGK